MIAIDWGTSSFRAFRLDAAGTVVDQRTAPAGILTVADGGFEAALRREAGDWLADGPVVMSGMIGSRQGWREAPYAACPAGAADLAAALLAVPLAGGGQAWIVPGVAWQQADVMRGEETQILGALDLLGRRDGLFCLPGTHCKWVLVEGGRIRRFATYMTGEVFAVMRQHSILGTLMQGEATDPEAFARGLDRSGAAGGLLHHLFGTRSLGLFGTLSPQAQPDYLSGLLIGHELRAALADFKPAGPVVLIGAEGLSRRYADALARFGAAAEPVGEAVVARGLRAILAARGER